MGIVGRPMHVVTATAAGSGEWDRWDGAHKLSYEQWDDCHLASYTGRSPSSQQPLTSTIRQQQNLGAFLLCFAQKSMKLACSWSVPHSEGPSQRLPELFQAGSGFSVLQEKCASKSRWAFPFCPSLHSALWIREMKKTGVCLVWIALT